MKTVYDRTFGKLRKMMGKGKKAMLYKKSGFLLQKSIVVALLAAVWGGGTANAEGRLKVGGTGDTPPVYFKDAQSVLIGFEVDVLREIGRRIGKDMEFTAIDWPRKTEILNSGTIDVIASALSITDERKVSYSITQPIINNAQVTVVLADSPVKEQDDLGTKTVCVLEGSFIIPIVEKFRGKSGPVAAIQTDTNESCLISMMGGEVDATVVDKVTAYYYVKHNPGVFRILPGSFAKDRSAFALRKGEAALRDQFDRAIAEMENDGTMGRLRKRWFDEELCCLIELNHKIYMKKTL